jgi:deoxyribonuclease (pyrimidine dimer)
MTRINSGIAPKELHRLHLIAEYREITMVPAALRRSLRTKSVESVKSSIPSEFTLNAGHVKFFYDKLTYLQARFCVIVSEMEARGYTVNKARAVAFDGFPSVFYKGWNETAKARSILQERIALRKSEKPHLYK